MNIEQLISALGFSKREAKIYAILVKMGSGTIHDIAHIAGEKRVTAYMAMKELEKNNLIQLKKRGKKNIVDILPPENILDIIEKNEKSLRDHAKKINRLIPELNKLYTLTHKTLSMQIFEGIEGIKSLRELFLKTESKEKIINFTSLDYLFKYFPEHEKEYTARRVKKKIASRIIYTAKSGPYLNATNPLMLREARYIPPTKFPLESDIAVRGNNVAIIPFRGELKGVLISHANIAKTIQTIFELAWKATEEYNIRVTPHESTKKEQDLTK